MSAAKTFTVTVDGEPLELPKDKTTPREILTQAGLDPADRYLIEKRGSKTVSYKDKPDVEIHVHERQIFLSARLGAVPVS